MHHRADLDMEDFFISCILIVKLSLLPERERNDSDYIFALSLLFNY